MQKKISARPRVRRRHRRGQEEQDREAAEHALQDDRAERGDAEPLHPAAGIGAPEPGREHDREEPDVLAISRWPCS